ncbi:hypothetical protein ACOMCU_09115 [Lysinibacillus sp. UGB7]
MPQSEVFRMNAYKKLKRFIGIVYAWIHIAYVKLEVVDFIMPENEVREFY